MQSYKENKRKKRDKKILLPGTKTNMADFLPAGKTYKAVFQSNVHEINMQGS